MPSVWCCSSPHVSTKILKPVMSLLLRTGIRLIIYLDDVLLMNASETGLQEDMHTAQYLLQNLGFVINLEKSCFQPTQQLEFLGFLVNTWDMTLLLPDCKVSSIKTAISTRCFSTGTISVDRQVDRLYPGCISRAFALSQFTTVETPTSLSGQELRFPDTTLNRGHRRTSMVASTFRCMERSSAPSHHPRI